MAALVFLVIMLTMFRHSDASWCVCRQDVSQAAQQKALDYACGAGADCGPIQQNGVCYNPNTVNAHCSYAVNSYYQRKGQVQGSCDFSATATVTNQEPTGQSGCTYPATPSAAGSSVTPTGTPSSTTPPGTFTPPGNILPGLGPTATGTGTGPFTTDGSGGGFTPKAKLDSLLLIIFVSGLILLSI